MKKSDTLLKEMRETLTDALAFVVNGQLVAHRNLETNNRLVSREKTAERIRLILAHTSAAYWCKHETPRS